MVDPAATVSEEEAVPPLPERFNLASYYLDRNLEEGRGEKTAIVCGKERYTYAEIAVRVERLTAVFRRLGLRAEERVLIVLPDGVEFVEAWFATLRAGGVFAMVNPLQKRDTLEYTIDYVKPRIIVTHASVLPEIADCAAESRFAENLLVVGGEPGIFLSYEGEISAQSSSRPGARCPGGHLEPTRPDDLAGWLFTSGSTGKPKACVHTHGDFAYSTETYAMKVAGYQEDDVCISVPKLFFGYATGTNLMFPFRVGATVILFPGRSTADELLDQIDAHRPTFMTGVPTLFGSMLRSERVDSTDLSSLRVCLSAGEALPEELYVAWKERTGVEILDGIGSAEMFHIYISNRMGDVKPGSLGRLVPGYRAEIVGPDDRPVPTGELGRLRISGGSTALCYWGDKHKSNETFQGRWCTTADIFRCDEEGYFSYHGRDDDLLKVSGIWVSPLEIENALLSHADVAEVCVIGHADDDGLTKPLAFVVCSGDREGCEGFAQELKAHVKSRLAPYKYPRWFEWREVLPKNDRGKIARKELKLEMEQQ